MIDSKHTTIRDKRRKYGNSSRQKISKKGIITGKTYFSGRACSGFRSSNKQFRSSADAVFRLRYIGCFQCALCVLSGAATAYPGNMDISVSGASGAVFDDNAKKFVPQYLFSFVVGFVFGKLIDFYELWIDILPTNIPCCVIYFVVSFLIFSLGIALSNRCGLPIVPTDLFPRELAAITGIAYTKVKIVFDVLCLAVTVGLTFFCLGQVRGLGIGTVIAAFTLGKAVGIVEKRLDKTSEFITII